MYGCPRNRSDGRCSRPVALFAIALVTGGYVLVAYSEDPVQLPAAELAATGRSISTAWRRGFVALLAALTGAMALNSVYPGPLPQTLGIENLAGLSIVGGIPLDVVQWSAGAAIVSVLAVGAGSMVVRYRRIYGDRRRTVTGWVFAVGAAGPPPEQWFYDGPEPPSGYPGSDPGWGRSPFEQGPNWDDPDSGGDHPG